MDGKYVRSWKRCCVPVCSLSSILLLALGPVYLGCCALFIVNIEFEIFVGLGIVYIYMYPYVPVLLERPLTFLFWTPPL